VKHLKQYPNHLNLRRATLKGLVSLAAFALLRSTILGGVSYVDLNSASPTPPYASWSTAATNIQDAIDAAATGDQILVTNGIYNTGGRVVYGAMTNRIALTKALTVQSVNGPLVTTIQGNQVAGDRFGDAAVRCAYLTNGSVLTGFTLTGGATRAWWGNYPLETTGGGVYCESTNAAVSNCILNGNVSVYDGGASYGGTLTDCTLVGNVATTFGGGAMSGVLNNCVVVSNTANSLGFGGGAYGSTLSNCKLQGNLATRAGGAAYLCTLNDCSLSNNVSDYGGGAVQCTLSNCIVCSNSAPSGGGAADSTLFGCSLTSNSAANQGGGSENCSLSNCRLEGNTSPVGGGAYRGSLIRCVLLGNAAEFGGGAVACYLSSCVISGNSASLYGGGVGSSYLNNCTVVGNSASAGGGGASDSLLNNCIVYYNAGGNYFPPDTANALNYCCTFPLPDTGVGNLTNAPLFVDLAGGNLRLQSDSPCIDAGNNSFVADSFDLDGVPRIIGDTVDMGAYEYHGPVNPSAALKRLIQLVNSRCAKPQPLLATLNAALGAIDRGAPAVAANQLAAFQNKVRAQVRPNDLPLATELINGAQHLMDGL
jgi:hypothetical protein